MRSQGPLPVTTPPSVLGVGGEKSRASRGECCEGPGAWVWVRVCLLSVSVRVSEFQKMCGVFLLISSETVVFKCLIVGEKLVWIPPSLLHFPKNKGE